MRFGIGRRIELYSPHAHLQTTPAAMTTPLTLSSHNLTRRHDNRMVVDNVSLELRRGEVLGLLGHNGAGKSTTLQMLCGALPPHSGKITVCGFDMHLQPQLAKACIGFLPEHPPLYRDLTVDDQLTFAARLHRVPAAQLAERLQDTKQRCGLGDCGKQFIGKLSKGYQQRVGIAQAIIHKPAVIVLDEPTVGLDPSQIRDIRTLIRELGDRSSVILSTHLLNEVENLCDHVAVLQRGRLIFSGSSDEMRQNGSIEEVFMQLNAQPQEAQTAP
jgi:ABC-2 type transport system ATP-binding protein